MACSTKSLKIFAIFWDVILAIFALTIISLGLYILIKFESYYTIPLITIPFGVVLLLTALFGALGAWKESSVFSRTYIGLLIIFVILELLCIGFLLFFQPVIIIHVNTAFDHLWGNPPTPIIPNTENRIKNLEKWFECCGNVGASDYHIPPHHCHNENGRLNERGCRQTILDFISESWFAFNIFAAVLVIVELISAILAYILANSIINRWRRSKYYSK